ncbi:MAG: thioredoxin domain-containing protein [Ignavibacteriales bacterium]|nr:thioredoxin domain-containing protein [Ignavibacteriales bacterium]
MIQSRQNSNRLINEKSPYLLQHAHNPVNWYPWSDEAFEKAKREDKPVFLSIGYSTCHWCHVMEHESFEDEETAHLMNQVFISIKVDREERPDIDNIYMMVCQMMNGSGGWPLTIIMTPGKKPFFSGTYFPKESHYGRIGFKDLILKIDEAWRTNRNEIVKSSEEITNYLKESYSFNTPEQLSTEIFEDAYRNFEKRFDAVHGGFGTAPKFPSPHNLMFLLRYWKRTGTQKALEMVTKTLLKMRQGGIFDQIGFGFHRYSTDAKWLVPHFEKMLYDQALLIMAYIEVYQATGISEFKETVDEIVSYVLRDMTSLDGGFYSAEDADSDGVEGKYYIWNQQELIDVLGKDDADIAFKVFKISAEGNFKEESTNQNTGSNILHLADSKENLVSENRLEKIRIKLFEYRKNRIRPYKDDKILSDWNALMIAALAKAGRVFDNSKYIKTAELALEFINRHLTIADGRLLHRFRNGESSLTANIDDNAFTIWALLELYESTFKADYIKEAILLTELSIKHFWDNNNGGFFFTPDFGESLIARTKEYYDGAIPSANSVLATNLLRLARITADSKYETFANKIFDSASSILCKNPQAFTLLLCSLDFAWGPSFEVIVAGNFHDEKTKKTLARLSQPFIPNKVVVFEDEEDENHCLPFNYLNKYTTIQSQPTFYVCKNFSCNMPTTDLDEALKQLS